MNKNAYRGHRFPPAIIQVTVWMYARFTLSLRDVEELLAERGLDISYETVRRWFFKFGQVHARSIRHRRHRPLRNEGRRVMMHEKIRPHHLERKAILYVRQSSAHQVLHNRESSALQYAMRERLAALGWARIETVDDDLGRSAAGGVARAGFDRMVAEICLGKVGAVAAREVSRFARNSRDWQQLIEMCRVVDTVLIDQETIYAPRQGNDRLLLGLKGSLNEYELDLLRQRSLSARYEKARRGELIVAAPVGFVKVGDRLEKDPDRRVQEAIILVFDKVAQLGSASRGGITRLWNRSKCARPLQFLQPRRLRQAVLPAPAITTPGQFGLKRQRPSGQYPRQH